MRYPLRFGGAKPKEDFSQRRKDAKKRGRKEEKKKSLEDFEPARRAGRSRISLARCVFANPRNQSLPFTLNPDKSLKHFLFFSFSSLRPLFFAPWRLCVKLLLWKRHPES
jgi:hypothetical protein